MKFLNAHGRMHNDGHMGREQESHSPIGMGPRRTFNVSIAMLVFLKRYLDGMGRQNNDASDI
jgi:hypothetical protein